MGPKQKGGGGGGPSKQKGNNAAEEVEESLQAVVCLGLSPEKRVIGDAGL